MTTGQIKELIAAYLHKPTSEFVKGTGPNQVDLLLTAINNARKFAERTYDFNACRRRGHLSVTNEVDWKTGVTWWDAQPWTTRKVKNWFLRAEGDETDGEFGGIDVAIRAVTHDAQMLSYRREGYEFSPSCPEFRYPGDANTFPWNNPLLGQTYAVTRGFNVSLYPQTTDTKLLIVDGFVWLNDYTADSDTDFFTDEGHEFLMWQGIVEANRLSMTFVGNQSGNIPPPTKEAEASLQKLITNDQETDNAMELFDL